MENMELVREKSKQLVLENESFTRYKMKRKFWRYIWEVSMVKRYLTSGQRGLPDFIIIGAQKAGTTSLHSYLSEHPLVLPPKIKEIHYFDLSYDRGTGWYRSLFPLKKELNGHITGEASPLYLYYPEVPSRIKELLPEVKLIVLLRDPAKRAISHVHHMIRRGLETRSLEEVFADGFDARLQYEQRLSDPWAKKTFNYLDRGLYADQLKRWFDCFDRDQFLILRSEDFYANTPETVSKTLEFLELPEYDGINFEKAHNQHGYKKPDPALVKALQEWYSPNNRELEKLLGMDFKW
ncbi:sulfotransferase [Robertkochia marina]|nr:sulfotransferase [Robertkochia marina]